MQCSKEFTITIAPAYPWSTLAWDQINGYAGTVGGSYESNPAGASWSGFAIAGSAQISVAAGHASGTYNGPLLNCVATFNLTHPPSGMGVPGVAFIIRQNGVSILSKSFVAGTIIAGTNVYLFTLADTSGLDETIEVMGGMSVGAPASLNNVFVEAVPPLGTRVGGELSIELP